MFYLNILWLGLLLLWPPQKGRWIINQNSNLSVNGTTNINKFTCDIPSYGQTDTLMISKAAGDIMLSGMIGLKVLSFDCHNKMMTADLRKTLKEKEYPLLYIRFLTLDGVGDLTLSPKAINGLVNIKLAGITKRFDVNYQVSVDADNVIHLLGSKEIKFSDFNLTPPQIRRHDQNRRSIVRYISP
ncbi:YceI family protein [Mucilaginibacter antarcticus]|uniref:YceI family protein n=1 Tax=Mucilaginibacter antarcticus TaxID=1855725 RepID=UPI0036360DF4